MQIHGSKSAKVRELLSLGASASDIAAQVGCTTALVYNIKARMAGGRKPGRPVRNKSAGLDSMDYSSFVSSIREQQNKTQHLRQTLERVAKLIADALLTS